MITKKFTWTLPFIPWCVCIWTYGPSQPLIGMICMLFQPSPAQAPAGNVVEFKKLEGRKCAPLESPKTFSPCAPPPPSCAHTERDTAWNVVTKVTLLQFKWLMFIEVVCARLFTETMMQMKLKNIYIKPQHRFQLVFSPWQEVRLAGVLYRDSWVVTILVLLNSLPKIDYMHFCERLWKTIPILCDD